MFMLMFSIYVYASIFSGTFNHPNNNTFTTDTTPNFNVTIVGQNDTYLVNLLINGVGNGSVVAGNNSLINITTISTLQEGTYVWSFNITNGSSANFTAINRTITIDTTNPNITFGSITKDNASYIKADAIPINVTVADRNIANFTFWLRDRNGTLVNRSIHANSTGNGKFINITSLPSSEYIYNVTVYDNASNVNRTVERSIRIDLVKPSMTFTMSSTSVSVGSKLTIVCSANDNLDTNVPAVLSVKIPSSETFETLGAGVGSYSDTDQEGIYTFRCYASDDVQNTVTKNIEVTVSAEASGSSSTGSSSSSSSGTSGGSGGSTSTESDEGDTSDESKDGVESSSNVNENNELQGDFNSESLTEEKETLNSTAQKEDDYYSRFVGGYGKENKIAIILAFVLVLSFGIWYYVKNKK
jgi:hypothetical protein